MKGLKTGGRTIGTPNKITSELRNTLKGIVDAELNSLPTLLAELPAKDRLEAVIRLMPYCLPKVESINAHYDSTAVMEW